MDESSGSAGDSIRVEVAYARPEKQRLIEIVVPAATPVREVLELSGIAADFGEIDTATCPIGVFGRAVDDDYVLKAEDRIEIYRPLTVNPRDARRARASNRG